LNKKLRKVVESGKKVKNPSKNNSEFEYKILEQFGFLAF